MRDEGGGDAASAVHVQYFYLHDASVVEAGGGRIVQVAVVDGSLQSLCCSTVVSSGTENPLRGQTSGLNRDTDSRLQAESNIETG